VNELVHRAQSFHRKQTKLKQVSVLDGLPGCFIIDYLLLIHALRVK